MNLAKKKVHKRLIEETEKIHWNTVEEKFECQAFTPSYKAIGILKLVTWAKD